MILYQEPCLCTSREQNTYRYAELDEVQILTAAIGSPLWSAQCIGASLTGPTLSMVTGVPVHLVDVAAALVGHFTNVHYEPHIRCPVMRDSTPTQCPLLPANLPHLRLVASLMFISAGCSSVEGFRACSSFLCRLSPALEHGLHGLCSPISTSEK